ncbi:dermonecrotic toxin domain-containing protein [Pseudomonas maumuensis]|uniref:Dermonecrotic toxin N-terminal domain-containing protein n=1 Tax=Pseudomonas maumuensis TaxID=2842354 RepID=A0ABX8NJU7_9PSED|nr:DUF6543 domain-containing protein [Pseudomonas maumuensis]QXH56284.1 hypothetical protein KSS90_23670 [Pseudomonas maumuensis]
MSCQPAASLDIQAGVAARFAARPTLRAVANRELSRLLAEPVHVSDVRHKPVPCLWLTTPGQPAREEPLADHLLRAMLSGMPPHFDTAPYTDCRFGFVGQPFASAQSANPKLLAALGAFPERIRRAFLEAQVDFWRADDAADSPALWLGEALRLLLLRNLPLQQLDSQQQDALLGLLRGGAQSPPVGWVEVVLEQAGQSDGLWLPGLLVSAEWDERKVLLWCEPSGVVTAYDSSASFAAGLQIQLAERYRFERMQWFVHDVSGDAIARQVGLLLNASLDEIRRLRWRTLADLDNLERVLGALSDPSRWLIPGYTADTPVPGLTLPAWLGSASPTDSLAYLEGVRRLAQDQVESNAGSSLGDVDALMVYAAEQLRQRMLSDHPVDGDYCADDLILDVTVARGMPGGAGVGPGGGLVEHSGLTLTSLAVGNLAALGGGNITAIRHARGAPIAAWLTPDYVAGLIQRADIGARYPTYVAQKLDDIATQATRIRRFAREWRAQLRFDALETKVAGQLDEPAWQTIADLTQEDAAPAFATLMPLAFRREPDSSASDVATCMFVIGTTRQEQLLLYRPLQRERRLLVFANAQVLMATLRKDQALRDSILPWLSDEARKVYAYGGFSEPHIGGILDTSLWPAPVKPATLALDPWDDEVDRRMFMARRQVMLELAGRQSVSNAEQRWQTLLEGAWLIFNLFLPLLPAPVALLGWISQGVHSLRQDFTMLDEGSPAQQRQALADLLLNVGLALLHLHLPSSRGPGPVAVSPALEGPASRDGATQPRQSAPVPLNQAMPTVRDAQPVDFSFAPARGLEGLSSVQKATLRQLRVKVALTGARLETKGPLQGLRSLAGRYYVLLMGEHFEVLSEDTDVWIVGPGDEPGPYLLRRQGNWDIDTGLRLRGGQPDARGRVRERLLAQFAELHQQMRQRVEQMRPLVLRQNPLIEQVKATVRKFDTAKLHHARLTQALRDGTAAPGSEALLAGFGQRIEVVGAELNRYWSTLVPTMEQLVALGEQQEATLKAMSQGKYDRPDVAMRADAVTVLRGNLRKQMISWLDGLLDGLWALADYPGMDRMAAELEGQEVSTELKQRYQVFRDKLQGLVAVQVRLRKVNQMLDDLLPETLNDPGFVIADKQERVREYIERRTYTTVNLDLHQAMCLAELALDRGADLESNASISLKQTFDSDSLLSAGSAHAELAKADVTLEERIAVLESSERTYLATLASAERLEVTFGEQLDLAMLERFKAQIELLRGSARLALNDAIHEKLTTGHPAQRARAYAVSPLRRRVVRTRRGRVIIGEETETSGVRRIQQRDPINDTVIATYREQAGDWVRDDEAPEPAATVDAAQLPRARRLARQLLGEMGAVIRLAGLYVRSLEPIGLSSVIDGHVERMSETQTILERVGAEEEAHALGEGIRTLRAQEQALLVRLYLRTPHPSAAGLRYLHGQGLVAIRAGARRVALAAGDFVDKYQVIWNERPQEATGNGLWEAHLHYARHDDPPHEFTKAHLKTWAQRAVRFEQALMAATPGRLSSVYRGNLLREDLNGIIDLEQA